MKVFYSFGNRKSRPVMAQMAILGGTKQPTDKKLIYPLAVLKKNLF